MCLLFTQEWACRLCAVDASVSFTQKNVVSTYFYLFFLPLLFFHWVTIGSALILELLGSSEYLESKYYTSAF